MNWPAYYWLVTTTIGLISAIFNLRFGFLSLGWLTTKDPASLRALALTTIATQSLALVALLLAELLGVLALFAPASPLTATLVILETFLTIISLKSTITLVSRRLTLGKPRNNIPDEH